MSTGSDKLLRAIKTILNITTHWSYWPDFSFRDARLFNIAVDTEKKKQLEMEQQVFPVFLHNRMIWLFLFCCFVVLLLLFDRMAGEVLYQ